MKILPVGRELFHATDGRTDRQTDRHDEANSRFLQFSNAPRHSISNWMVADQPRDQSLYWMVADQPRDQSLYRMICNCSFITWCFFYHGVTAPVGQGFPIIKDSRSHSDTPHSVGLLWTRDHPDAETSTWPHTTLTIDRYPCHRRDSNPQSQQASGRRPTS